MTDTSSCIRTIVIGIFVLGLLMVLVGCSDSGKNDDRRTYKQISMDEAAKMISEQPDLLIVDVRAPEEYAEGHIPKAINIPLETIGSEKPQQLPDLKQTFLVYCRSGRRSKEAAEKLLTIGYENIIECGGILDWKGEIESEQGTAEEEPVLKVEINGENFIIDLSDSTSSRALVEKLKEEDLIVEMHDYGNFEKVGNLPYSLPRNDQNITTSCGDVILYLGNQITIYYDTNTWEFTRLGKVRFTDPSQLRNALGKGNVTVRFYLEKSE